MSVSDILTAKKDWVEIPVIPAAPAAPEEPEEPVDEAEGPTVTVNFGGSQTQSSLPPILIPSHQDAPPEATSPVSGPPGASEAPTAAEEVPAIAETSTSVTPVPTATAAFDETSGSGDGRFDIGTDGVKVVAVAVGVLVGGVFVGWL